MPRIVRPTRAPKESSVEKFFVEETTKLGLECRKYKTRTHDPDRLILGPNRLIIFVELKRPKAGAIGAGTRPRPGQVREHQRLHDMGFPVYVLSSRQEVETFIEMLKAVI